MNAKLQVTLSIAGITTTRVVVLGKFIHIDSFSKHDTMLKHVLTSAGFRVLKANDGVHLDGFDGYRISAKLA